MATPVLFVHGLWLHATSWQAWVDLFTERGYAPIAPEWPGIPDTVASARENASEIPPSGVAEVTDHYAGIIQGLPEKPIVIGHSFGGLIIQKLLGRNLGVAGVAIDPAPIKGVLALPVSSLRVAGVALRNPLNLRRAVGLTESEWRYGFGNALDEAESKELYEKWMIPTPGKPLFQAASANLHFGSMAPTAVDTANSHRGPLLITAGGKDHTVPAAVSRATAKLYRKSGSVTELKEFPDRGHSLTLDHGWLEVAETVLTWLKEKGF